LSSSFKFLAHDSFLRNLKEFRQKYSKFEKSLLANLQRAQSEPFSGKALHSLPKKLRQKIYRLWIGGPEDFRFIYYVDQRQELVLGVYISLVPRAQFSYDEVNWDEILTEIIDDLDKGRMDKFAHMKT